MTAAQWFQLRDRIEALLHEDLDPVAPNSQAYANAVRVAAEKLLSTFEISEARPSGGAERLRLQLQVGPFIDHASIAQDLARDPQFRDTEHARRAVARQIFDTPMATAIVPIVVGWAHKTDVFHDLRALASNPDVRVEIVAVVRTDDGQPGSLATARITFDLRRGGNGTRHDVVVSGADATTAIEAWNLR